MSLIDVQRAAVQLCCGPEPSSEQAAALGDERVWRLYRELIRKRLLGELRIALKRTYAAAGAEAFARAFDQHLRSDPPRTRFFHALVAEFVRDAAPLFRGDPALPAYLADLAEYEAAVWTVSDLDDRAPPQVVEFAFDRPPVLAPALRLLALRYAVHVGASGGGIAPALRGGAMSVAGGYEPGDVYLCVHRRPDEKKAKTWTLNVVTFALMQHFSHSPAATVGDAVQQVARERGIAVDQTFLDGLCTVLADFIERGILLGSR